MIANFGPGTPQGQKIFDAKTGGLLENKTFEITTAEGAALRWYFFRRQAALGGGVTNIPIEYNVDATVKTTANLIKQYQLIPFSTLQRKAYKCCVGNLAPNAPLPINLIRPTTKIEFLKAQLNE